MQEAEISNQLYFRQAAAPGKTSRTPQGRCGPVTSGTQPTTTSGPGLRSASGFLGNFSLNSPKEGALFPTPSPRTQYTLETGSVKDNPERNVGIMQQKASVLRGLGISFLEHCGGDHCQGHEQTTGSAHAKRQQMTAAASTYLAFITCERNLKIHQTGPSDYPKKQALPSRLHK